MGLLSLLPGRHADFELGLEIHDLQNVPLVSGTFSVEWKFKSSKAHPEQVLQDKTDSLASKTPHPRHHHSHTSTSSTAASSTSTSASTTTNSPPRLSSSSSSSTRPRSLSSLSSSNQPSSLQLKKTPTSTSFSSTALTQITTNSSTNTSASTNSTASDSNSPRSSSDSHNNDSSSASPSSDNNNNNRLSSSSFSRINKTKSSLNLKKTAKRQLLSSSSKNEHGKPLSSSSKGQTEGVEIRDHSCTWSQEVRSHIRVAVGAGKELGVLGERELRVVVHQHLSFHENEKSARLGQLVLNLAEFAGKGKVTRRYLLEGGKTNATIKLSIELVQISGQTSWISIPVSKGQAAGAGLENLVGNHTRPMGDVHASPASPALSTTSLASKQQTRPSSTNQTPSSSHPPSTRNSSQNLTSLLTPNAALLNGKASSSSVSFCSSTNTTTPSTPLLSSSLNLPSASASLNGSTITLPLNPLHKPAAAPKTSRTRTSSPVRTGGNSTTPPTFFAPTSTESIIESIFNPRPSTVAGPFTIPMPPPISRSSTANTSSSHSDHTEDGSYLVVGNGKVGSSPLKQQMSANNLNGNSSSSRGKLAVLPSAWKKKGNARGREVSGGSVNGVGLGGEEGEGGVVAGGGVGMSRGGTGSGVGSAAGGGSKERGGSRER